MTFRKKPQKRPEPLCEEIQSDDGQDPRRFFDRRVRGKPNRKALQLCSQASHAISHALASDRSEVLRDLVVVAVVPAPVSSRLLVRLSLFGAGDQQALEDAAAALAEAKPRLRRQVAEAVTRRRAPDLAFELVVQDIRRDASP
jgi:ribosome-binding factor A